MGEDPGRIRQQIAETREQLSENREADEIRSEIQETRQQMGETVEALGRKADVKTRVKDSITDKKDAVVEKADSLHKVTGAVPDGSVKQGGAKVGEAQRWASRRKPARACDRRSRGRLPRRHPSPSTRVEDENLGEVSDQVIDRVKETGQDALERVRVAQETLRERQGHGRPQRRRTKPECGRGAQGNCPRPQPNRNSTRPDPSRLGGLASPAQPSSDLYSAANAGLAHAAIVPRHLPTGSPRRGRGGTRLARRVAQAETRQATFGGGARDRTGPHRAGGNHAEPRSRARPDEGCARAHRRTLGRLKPNGRLRERSPLSDVLELETSSWASRATGVWLSCLLVCPRGGSRAAGRASREPEEGCRGGAVACRPTSLRFGGRAMSSSASPRGPRVAAETAHRVAVPPGAPFVRRSGRPSIGQPSARLRRGRGG